MRRHVSDLARFLWLALLFVPRCTILEGRRMVANRRIRLILFGLGLASLLLAVQPLKFAGDNGGDQDRSAILEVLKNQQSNWNKGDVDDFLEGYWRSPELTFSGTGGIARGWEAVRARYKKNYGDRETMGQLQFADLEFRFLGPDAALVLGHWHLTRAKGDIGGVFSLVWQRFPEGWRIVHDHTSVVGSSQ
jgi:ketosteroid isomerase-like protein